MQDRTIAMYAREIRPLLQRSAFAQAQSRLWWLPIHLIVIATLTTALAQHWLPWLVAPVVSLVIGMSFAGLTFLGHETLHGAVVRGSRASSVGSAFCPSRSRHACGSPGTTAFTTAIPNTQSVTPTPTRRCKSTGGAARYA
jgi:hypothetical protein